VPRNQAPPGPGFLSSLKLTEPQVPYFSSCFLHGSNRWHVLQIVVCSSTAIFLDGRRPVDVYSRTRKLTYRLRQLHFDLPPQTISHLWVGQSALPMTS
jgi:hypothetical protein